MYAESLKQILESGSTNDLLDFTDFPRKMWNTTFEGVTGNVRINPEGERISDFTIKCLMANISELNYTQVAVLRSDPSAKLEFYFDKSLKWFAGGAGLPAPYPFCSYYVSNSTCLHKPNPSNSTLILSMMVVVLSVLAITAAVFAYKKYATNINPLEESWRIDWSEFDFLVEDSKNEKSNNPLFEYEGSLESKDIYNTGCIKGDFKGKAVLLKRLKRHMLDIDQTLIKDATNLKEVGQENLIKFIGVCINETFSIYAVNEYLVCRKKLVDVIGKDYFRSEWMLTYSILYDIIKGMSYLHATDVKFHGRLRSSKIFLDSRFTVKISDFGFYPTYQCCEYFDPNDKEIENKNNFCHISRDYDNSNQKKEFNLSLKNSSMRNEKDTAIVPPFISDRKTDLLNLLARHLVHGLWKAPEILKEEEIGIVAKTEQFEVLQRCDVYSFGIILYQILAKCRWPYNIESPTIVTAINDKQLKGPANHRLESGGAENFLATFKRKKSFKTPQSYDVNKLMSCADRIFHLLKKIKQSAGPILRPDVTMVDAEIKNSDLPNAVILRQLKELMIACWAQNSKSRPTFPCIKSLFKSIMRNDAKQNNNVSSNNSKLSSFDNVMEVLLSRMEKYANSLEVMVEERTEDYLEEKKRSEKILYQVLPKSVAEILKKGQTFVPEQYKQVTIYFSDVVGFTSLSSVSTPIEIVDFLNDLYTCFDEIIEEYDVYKVETIGDSYMVAGGLTKKNTENKHAYEIAKLSLKIMRAMSTFKIKHKPQENLKIRIGIHTGPCAAGVVGVKMPRYCLFGDTVNTASRMESNGEPQRIHISEQTKMALDKFQDTFVTELRGEINIKGKGVMKTYWLSK
ncbi:unnamed protein product [Gordionus sp. m RMFG-2023]